MKKVKAVFFDFDGTLIDSKTDIVLTVNRMRKELNLSELSEDEILIHVGKGPEYLLEKVLTPEVRIKEIIDKFLGYYIENALKYTVFYDGVFELLEKLDGYHKVLITNKAYIVTKEILKKYNLEDTFTLVYGGDSLPKKKPDPYPLQFAVEKLNINADEVIFFGDSIYDYEACERANVKCVLAKYGYSTLEELEVCKNAILIDKPLELLDYVNN